MKASIKKFWIALSTLICLILILCAGLFILFYTETKEMTPVTSQEIFKGIYAVQDKYVNLFLIKSGSQYIAIDAGISVKQVQNELKKLDIDPQHIMAVFLTHSDSDHIGGLELFKNATVYLPEKEEEMINGQTSRMLFLKNKLNHPYTIIKGNQIIDVSGLTIKGISAPGHTPGAMCYLVNGVYLFTGDAMSLKDGKAETFNALFNMDPQTHQTSLESLSTLENIKYIFTAHYGYSDHF